MNNLTKIAALPTGGGCQSALRPEDKGVERKRSTGGVTVKVDLLPLPGIDFHLVVQRAMAMRMQRSLDAIMGIGGAA
jgi:hypothetical protein